MGGRMPGCMTGFWLGSVGLLLAALLTVTTCQRCSGQADCPTAFPCCSQAGFCGKGEAYCAAPKPVVVSLAAGSSGSTLIVDGQEVIS